ncbi:MAG: TIGR03617 family F420-dependent LLM class oxidoreductase [Candidatus Binatia bacterium]
MQTERFIVEAELSANDLWRVPAEARRLEALGYSAAFSIEAIRDPFLPLVVAAEHTTRLGLGTSVAIAFPRAPMVTAQLSWDLQRFSKGRFLLGLGSQVRKHNEERFSVKWTAPVARMREYIETLRAIWESWQQGTKPAFVGEHYRYTYTSPFFHPGPIEHPRIPVAIAAVNPAMCRLAGELCEGVRLHPFCTRLYLEKTILPNIAAGALKSGRRVEDVELAGGGFIATGADDGAVEQRIQAVRRQIAFYGSTPAYFGVLEAHGWGELGGRLNQLARTGKWEEMAAAVPDEVVEAFTAIGRYDEIAPVIRNRFRGIARVPFPAPSDDGREEGLVREILQALTGEDA